MYILNVDRGANTKFKYYKNLNVSAIENKNTM